MNEIIENLEAEIRSIVGVAQTDESLLKSTIDAIKRGEDVPYAPSVILARIARLEGKMHGLEAAINIIKQAQVIA